MTDTPQNYNQHWDDKFRGGSWGRYPPEDLVRLMARHYSNTDRKDFKVLEVGCGPGANLWFLHREGYNISGIDGSPAGIEAATKRIEEENKGLNPLKPDLKVGSFPTLPWPDQNFDLVIDIFALYANTLDVIQQTVSEINRVLKPGGHFYTKLWGRECSHYGEGIELEPGTYDEIPHGVCKDMGVSHFFDRPEIEQVFSCFEIITIDKITRTDSFKDFTVEEYLCHFSAKDR